MLVHRGVCFLYQTLKPVFPPRACTVRV
uniref:Uncharacterized protein n=1 Tax=Anguilla anguilla TaxID=7936 RepID=A0A0E9PYK6_ANGAN